MANGEERLVVLDAGPIIHLDELQCLHLLAGFQALYIPSAVWQEIVHHRPELTLAQIPQAAILDPATALPPRLASAPDTRPIAPWRNRRPGSPARTGERLVSFGR